MFAQNLSTGEQDQVAELLSHDHLELKSVFFHLPAPAISEVSGEYDARLLDQGSRLEAFLTDCAFGWRGPWIGKAFRPVSDSAGEGYNTFGTIADRKVDLPMDTYLARSERFYGQSYIIDYRKRNRGPIRWLVGELRQVSDNLLLGMGHFGPREGKFRKLRRVIPFVLARSNREYLLSESRSPARELCERPLDRRAG